MRIGSTTDDDDDLIDATPPGRPPGEQMSSHINRSGVPTDGPRDILIGIVLAWIGSRTLLQLLLGEISPSDGAPVWVASSSSLLLAAIGILMITHGIGDMRRRSRTAVHRAANPREPWAWDHQWSPFGSRDDASRAIAHRCRYVVIMALLLAPLHWGYVSGEESDAVLAAAVVIMDAFVISAIVWIGYLLVRRRKYGVRVVRFRRFPFLTGGEVEVSLARFGALTKIQGMTATLRCVQERFETRQRGRKRRTRVVCYEVWSATKLSEEAEGRRPAKGDFTWRFTVPDDVPGTALSERPSRYWELEVTADVPGVDFGAIFLIPVYERPRAEWREESLARLAG